LDVIFFSVVVCWHSPLVLISFEYFAIRNSQPKAVLVILCSLVKQSFLTCSRLCGLSWAANPQTSRAPCVAVLATKLASEPVLNGFNVLPVEHVLV
jgi:hypothetical protein